MTYEEKEILELASELANLLGWRKELTILAEMDTNRWGLVKASNVFTWNNQLCSSRDVFEIYGNTTVSMETEGVSKRYAYTEETDMIEAAKDIIARIKEYGFSEY